VVSCGRVRDVNSDVFVCLIEVCVSISRTRGTLLAYPEQAMTCATRDLTPETQHMSHGTRHTTHDTERPEPRESHNGNAE